jgi:hypothetical protein
VYGTLAGRRAALDGMRRALRDGGLLAITSRNWERPQEAGDEVVERDGRRATGFEPEASTWSPEAERYLVTSRANSSNASR